MAVFSDRQAQHLLIAVDVWQATKPAVGTTSLHLPWHGCGWIFLARLLYIQELTVEK